MGWKRTRMPTTELPPSPSMMRWLVSGAFIALLSVLLFILHASGTVKELNAFNIWWLSLTPSGLWLLLLCLRGWLWEREVDKYAFLKKEADRGQKQWEAWAERYLVILANAVLLPDGVTASAVLDSSVDALPSRRALTRRLKEIGNPVNSFLASLQSSLQQLPRDLPLRVTLITDLPGEELTEAFSTAWCSLFPQRDVPDDFNIVSAMSMSQLEQRLQQPLLTVDLVLVLQLCGGEAYSDELAALLMTSDDVAQKYRLPHSARLLRPMPLDRDKFDEDFTLFLETQTAACRTTSVLGDSAGWEAIAAPLITIGNAHGARWEPAERMHLEKWCGIPGPAAPWLLTALAADLVTLQKTSLLMLFSSGEERFISTVTSGSENEHIR
ncbi:type VI secretion protein [Erwinia sp. CGal63]|uniref:type VI secretion protein n=1 Tax=Erwinia sp. CGal63 TaxID=2919889 RepID=UPI003009C218